MSSQEESTLNECVSVVTPDTKQGRAIPCVKESISVAFWGAACVDRVQQVKLLEFLFWKNLMLVPW